LFPRRASEENEAMQNAELLEKLVNPPPGEFPEPVTFKHLLV
jgi:hypothetical protein